MDRMQALKEMLVRLGIDPKTLKKGVGITQTPVPGSSGVVLEEGVSVRRKDNPGNTACSYCGSSNDLKACGSCGQRYYCGKECRRVSRLNIL